MPLSLAATCVVMSKKNASAMKRIMSEIKELESDPSPEYRAVPTEVRIVSDTG